MIGHFVRLLEAIAANPDERISRYELLGDDERRQVLVEWNRNQQPYPEELTLHGLFEAQAARTPDATALVFEGAHLTYGALDARANQLAHYLVAHGVVPEMRVGLCLERSFEMMIGILGVLKAGGAYVPLDPNYPKARLDYIIADADVHCVVTQSHLRDHLSDGVELVCVDELQDAIAARPEESPAVPVLAQNLAYVIHTSGSTGNPKGVMVMHRSVVNLAYAQQTRLAGVPGTRVLQFASFSFDGSMWEFVMAWTRGAALVLAPRERMLPGEALTELMNAEGVDIATLPPSALAVLSPEALPRFRTLISAGEALSMAQVTPWLEGRTVMNGYGPTESTVDASVGDVCAGEPITIGRPIPNISYYILDRTLQPVPIGVAGELHIGGAGLARGYLGRPALTAERFLPNPFGAPGSRMYRTGDLARYRPDGKVEYVGRHDHQVKIRGFRIELGEIEAALERHPALGQVLVIASGTAEARRLIAYYTLRPAADEPSPSELRAFLRQTLPDYMVPGFFVALDTFPLTPNGKIDRAALPAPDVAGALARQYVAPRTPLEQTLAGIWQEVLHVPQVGVHDNFFELGGHSLLAVQLISRTEQVLEVVLPVIELYKHPTIAGLAAQLTRMTAEGASVAAAAQSEASPLVMLSPREGGAPLVVIPGIVGVLPGYYDLAHAVGEVRPVYGLHALSAQENGIRHTVESIARLYAESLLEMWDRGPFHILGHSYGGIVAFEIVRQLEQQGYQPRSLILVDSDPLALKMKELSPNAFVLRYMGQFLRLDAAAVADALETFELEDGERLPRLLHDLASRRLVDGSPGYERIHQWVRTIRSRYVDAYAPEPYRPAAPVLKIWAQHGAMTRRGTVAPDADSAWQQILQKETDRFVVPGDHESLVGRQYVPRLSRILNQWMEERTPEELDVVGGFQRLAEAPPAP